MPRRPYAGLLVERYPKRRVLLATQIGLGLVSAALGAAVLAGDIRLWQVVVLAVLFGILSAVDNPARQAFLQEVVGRDLVRNAVTLKTTSVNVARVTATAVLAPVLEPPSRHAPVTAHMTRAQRSLPGRPDHSRPFREASAASLGHDHLRR